MAAGFTLAAAVYLWTAWRAAGRPLNLGADRLWAALWIFLVVLVAVSQAFVGGRLVRHIWAPGIVAAALAMTVLSGGTLAVAITLWMLGLAWATGDRILRAIAPPVPEERWEGLVIATGLGLAALALLSLLLMLAHALTKGGGLASLLLLTAFAFWTRRRRASGQRPRKRAAADGLPERSAILVLLGFMALANLAWALAPEVQYDGMNYQLSVPAVYAAEHRLVNLPIFWHSYFSRFFNFLFALGFSIDGGSVGKLLVFATGLFAACGTYALGRALWSERVGLWAAAAFYTTPLVGWLSSTAYVDLPVTFFTIGSLLALLRWRADRTRLAWLVVSGALAGAALGSKLTALSSVVALLAALAFLLFRGAGVSFWRRMAAGAAFSVPLALVALPSYAVTYAFTKNPFFPLFNGVFKSPGFDPVNSTFTAYLFGIGKSPLSLLALPFVLTYRTGRFGEATPDGAAGLALALAPLTIVFAWRAFSGRRVLLVLIAVYFAIWALNVQYARFYIPLLPAVCVAAAAAVESAARRRSLAILSLVVGAIVLAAQVPLHALQYWNIHERIPLRFAFGKETREAFLSRALGGVYPAVQYLNGVARPDEKAVTGGADPMRLYLKIPLASMTETFELRVICRGPSFQEVASNLVRNGYRYLLVNGDLDTRFPFSNPDFLRQFATLEFQNSTGRVYRIHEDALPDSAFVNLLVNPGFESLDESGRPRSWVPNGNPSVLSGSEAHEGSVAMLVDPENFVSQPVAVDPGSRYRLRVWTRRLESKSSIRLQVNWLKASGSTMDSTIEVHPASSFWSSQEMLVLVPPGATTAVVFASVHAGKVAFDDFSFLPERAR